MSPRLLLNQHSTARDGRAMRRAHSSGELHRIRRGSYLFADEWESLDRRWAHIATICAQMRRLRSSVTVSHASAAALWGFPALDGWPERVHVIDPRRSNGQQTPTLCRHPGAGAAEAVETTSRYGIPCTSALRTAVDVGLTDGFLSGLLALDFGLRTRLFSLDEVAEAARIRGSPRGVRRLREALSIASGASASAGESISKGTIHDLGLPPPVLQKRFPNPAGGSYYVDFWWEEFGLIGEFDGDQKYLDEAMRSGLSIEQVMLAEKQRADRLRALPEVRNLVRWNYATARKPPILRRLLLSAGLRPNVEAPSSGRASTG